MRPRPKQEQMARLYDAEILPIWAQRFGRLLLAGLEVPPKALVLDVACGTGYPALDLLKRMDGDGRIIAIDASTPMLDVARHKAGTLGGRRIFFRTESCEPKLSFDSAVYDLVVSNLGLYEVADPQAVLAELARVTKPGGRVVTTLPLAGTFGEFYDIFREVLFRTDRREALRRLDQRLGQYPTTEQLRAWHARAGLEVAELEHDTFTLLFQSSREFFFAPVIEHGPLLAWKTLVGNATEMQDTFRQVKETIDSYFGPRGFHVTVHAACARATRPTGRQREGVPLEDTLTSEIPTSEKAIVLSTGEIQLLDDEELATEPDTDRDNDTSENSSD